MANFKSHSWTGIAIGILTELSHVVYQRTKEKKELSPNEIGGRLLIAGIGGFLGSVIPDLIDPATGPNHRDIGHGIVLCLAGVAACAKATNKAESPYRKAFVKGITAGGVLTLL